MQPEDLQVEQWPIDRLVEYGRNPRKNDVHVDRMASMIREFGFRIPIVAKSDGTIADGHLRYKAARKLGLATVPVALADGLTDAQIKAFRLLANKSVSWAEWDEELLAIELSELRDLDFDLSLTGFDDLELDSLLAEKTEGLTDPDDVPEVPEEPVTVAGDVWVLGRHRLVCGDTTSQEMLAKALAGAKVDCVFTSPPYAVGVDYGTYEDTIDNLRGMLPHLAKLWHDAVLPGGFAVVNFSDIASAQKIAGSNEPCEYPMAVEYWPVFREAGWVLFTRRIWKKPHARVHSPWAIKSCRAASDWEHLWIWKKTGKPLKERGDYSAFGVWDSADGRGVDVGKEAHGAGMPVNVATRAIETHSRPGQHVLEPFSGTGTTMLACELTGRACHGLEIEAAYVDIAIKRWLAFTGQHAVLESTGQTFAQVAEERLGPMPERIKRATVTADA